MISLIIHLLIVVAIYYSYKTLTPYASQKAVQERIEVCLCSVSIKPPETPKQTIEPKKEIQEKAKPKLEKKELPKPKEIKKTTPQKPLEALKPIPKVENLIQTKPIAEEKTLEQVKDEKESTPKELLQENTAKTPQVVKETLQQKQERLSQEYFNNHLNKISQLLRENLYYPRSARKRGIQGKVLVAFTLSKDGSISNVHVVNSKSEILSNAAIKTINKIAQDFPAPPQKLELQVPINYSLSR